MPMAGWPAFWRSRPTRRRCRATAPPPPPMPGDPANCLGSMGIYVFTARTLYELLCQDAIRQDSHHDFGTDIIPPMLGVNRVFAYRFQDRNNKDMPYWRDVGTID